MNQICLTTSLNIINKNIKTKSKERVIEAKIKLNLKKKQLKEKHLKKTIKRKIIT